jgi:1-acyl-sn-glycerol-3-phosphate acyltransferase
MEPTFQLAKAIIKPAMSLWFRLHMEGLENIPRKGPAILAFNHIAYLDPFLSALAVDRVGRRPRFLGKSELFQDRRVAWILRGAKQIEVKRGTREAPVALDNAVNALKDGEIIVVFPEGTITNDADLNMMEPKTGTARLALLAGVPVIPGGLWGTQNVWPKGHRKRWWPPRQDLLLRIGKPMPIVGDPDTREDWQRVGTEISREISILVAGLRPIVPDRRRSKKAA